MNRERFEGLEQARKEFNDWQGQARIYIDFDAMTAWCRVFELPMYERNSIIRLVGKDDMQGRNERYGVEKLNKLVQAKLRAYENNECKFYLESDYVFAEFL